MKNLKRILILFFVLFIGLQASAEFVEVETDVNMANYWDKEGKDTQKVLSVGEKIINANKLPKRVNIILVIDKKTVNACAYYRYKSVYVYSGLLPYIDNDDEMAFVLSHEMTHVSDFYDGTLKAFAMFFNSKAYETKADEIGIDMMVNAGYNPIAAICVMNKISNETIWTAFKSHPRGSERLLYMYKYIYKKYPWALKTDMVKNVNYQNFTYSAAREIEEFQKHEAHRENNQPEAL